MSQFQLQPGRASNKVFHPLEILDAGQLHNNLILDLAASVNRYRRLRDTELVYPLRNDLPRLANRLLRQLPSVGNRHLKEVVGSSLTGSTPISPGRCQGIQHLFHHKPRLRIYAQDLNPLSRHPNLRKTGLPVPQIRNQALAHLIQFFVYHVLGFHLQHQMHATPKI